MSYPWVLDGHKIFRIVLVVQWLIAIAIGFMTGEVAIALMFGIPILAVPLALSFLQPDSRLSRVAVGVGVQLMTALHIDQTHGLIEMHFEIFLLLAFLIYFRDWLVIAASTVIVALHHVGFFVLQTQGAEVFVFEAGHISFNMLVLHAVFAVAEAGVLMFMAKKVHDEGVSSFELSNAVEQMLSQDGRIDLSVTSKSKLEHCVDFKDLLEQIRQLVTDASRLTDNVASATGVINDVAGDLSRTSRENTNEVSSISSASEQIVVSMQMTSERTQLANDVTSQANELTAKSRSDVDSTARVIASLKAGLEEAARTNSELNDRCSNISEAMRSITSVAEQTNLLALNAAIESARAGEHGRGFAVVADEVRTLAIRSKESAEEITNITESLVNATANSVSQMQSCIELVDDAVNNSNMATGAMSEIEQKIKQASSHMAEVASATLEQEVSTRSIAESGSRMTQLSRQEAERASQLESQVQQLGELCRTMQNAIKKFAV